jgi:hypothetical protein
LPEAVGIAFRVKILVRTKEVNEPLIGIDARDFAVPLVARSNFSGRPIDHSISGVIEHLSNDFPPDAGTLIAPDDAVLTVEEVAAWLRVKPSWVTARAARRRRPYLPCFKAGRYPRFLRSAILKFVAELSQNKINS